MKKSVIILLVMKAACWNCGFFVDYFHFHSSFFCTVLAIYFSVECYRYWYRSHHFLLLLLAIFVVILVNANHTASWFLSDESERHCAEHDSNPNTDEEDDSSPPDSNRTETKLIGWWVVTFKTQHCVICLIKLKLVSLLGFATFSSLCGICFFCYHRAWHAPLLVCIQ